MSNKTELTDVMTGRKIKVDLDRMKSRYTLRKGQPMRAGTSIHLDDNSEYWVEESPGEVDFLRRQPKS